MRILIGWRGAVVFLALGMAAWVGCKSKSSVACRVDADCPVHQSCDSAKLVCVTGCLSSDTCPGQVCGEHGRCVDPTVDTDAGGGDGSPISSDGPASDGATVYVPPLGCGDGMLQMGEQCDLGVDNSDNPTSASTCTTGCAVRTPCGDLAGSTGARIDPATGYCYVRYAGPANWSDAQHQCELTGALLASVISPNENSLLQSLAGQTAAWIGAVKILGSSSFQWVTGDPMSYTMGWASGQPDNAPNKECGQSNVGGWTDENCGWPSTGMLPANSTATASAFVCKHTCGNGRVGNGESCEPPGTATCTSTCQNKVACTDSGGVLSDVTGHCYFVQNVAATFALASAAGACGVNAHLATQRSPSETAAGQMALTHAGVAQAWIDLSGTSLTYSWAGGRPADFNPRRYHGFTGSYPATAVGPTCVTATQSGWQDASCGLSLARLCERDQ